MLNFSFKPKSIECMLELYWEAFLIELLNVWVIADDSNDLSLNKIPIAFPSFLYLYPYLFFFYQVPTHANACEYDMESNLRLTGTETIYLAWYYYSKVALLTAKKVDLFYILLQVPTFLNIPLQEKGQHIQ